MWYISFFFFSAGLLWTLVHSDSRIIIFKGHLIAYQQPHVFTATCGMFYWTFYCHHVRLTVLTVTTKSCILCVCMCVYSAISIMALWYKFVDNIQSQEGMSYFFFWNVVRKLFLLLLTARNKVLLDLSKQFGTKVRTTVSTTWSPDTFGFTRVYGWLCLRHVDVVKWTCCRRKNWKSFVRGCPRVSLRSSASQRIRSLMQHWTASLKASADRPLQVKEYYSI